MTVHLTALSVASVGAALTVLLLGSKEVEGEVLSMCRGIGLQPFIDVTVPHEASFSEFLAVLYSLVPWVISIAMVVGAAVRRTSTLLAGACYILLVVLSNEVLVKRNFPQARPVASCLVSPGMPSSHSLLSIGLLVWLFLEMAENQGVKTWWGFVAILVLAPVPPSRVVLQDHSLEQVTAGSLLGIASAITFFTFLRKSTLMRRLCSHPYAVKLGVRNDYFVH